MENQVNIDPKRHRKNDAKKQGTKIANKTIFDSRQGRYTFSSPPGPPSREGERTHFWDLDPVWERERERVNRDALTRLKTPQGSADSLEKQWKESADPSRGLVAC